jgi:hypothetical protein
MTKNEKIINDRILELKLYYSSRGYNYIYQELKNGVASAILRNDKKIKATKENSELENKLNNLNDKLFKIHYEELKNINISDDIRKFKERYKCNNDLLKLWIDTKKEIYKNIKKCELLEDASEKNETLLDDLYEFDHYQENFLTKIHFILYKEILEKNNIISYEVIK